MDEEFNALVFFDGDCNFCKSMIAYLMDLDKSQKFHFAPLKGETAKKYLSERLPNYQSLNTVVFLLKENQSYQVHLYAKAVFKALGYLGGLYTIYGWLFHLPSWLIDPFYRFIAKRRRYLPFKGSLNENDSRLLP